MSAIVYNLDAKNTEKPMFDESKLYTIEQVVDRLSISKGTFYNRVKTGRFHPVRDRSNRKRIFVHPKEVEEEEKKSRGASVNIMKSSDIPKTVSTHVKSPVVEPPKKKIEEIDLKQEAFLGKKTSLAVALFSSGKDLRDCAQELEMSFELAGKIYEQWKISGPEWHLPPNQFSYLRKRFNWEENPPSAAGFMTAVQIYVQKEIASFLEGLKSLPENDASPAAKEASPPATPKNYETAPIPIDDVRFD